MKKEYEIPTIKTSYFVQENIVTDSTLNREQLAYKEALMKSQGGTSFSTVIAFDYGV